MDAAKTAELEVPTRQPVPAVLLAWARQTFDAEEYWDGVRDIEATGGHSLESFLAELQSRALGT